MRIVSLMVAGLLMAAAPTQLTAQTTSDPSPLLAERDVAAFRDVIELQLAAFQTDDADRAYGLASAKIRRAFPSAEIFMTMVKAHYRPVYRPKRFTFRNPVMIEGRLVQPIDIVSQDGTPVTALYIVVSENVDDDGATPAKRWRIDGVVLTRPDGNGA